MTKKQGTITDFIRYYSFVKAEDSCNWIVLTINPKILDHDQILHEINSPMDFFPKQKINVQSLKKLRDLMSTPMGAILYKDMMFRWTSTQHHILLVVVTEDVKDDAETD